MERENPNPRMDTVLKVKAKAKAKARSKGSRNLSSWKKERVKERANPRARRAK